MNSKAKKITIIALVAILAVFLLVQGCRVGYDLYRELTFYNYPRSDAELAVMAFAKENGISYSAYPQNLIELLERNPETEKFVLEYPFEKNKSHTIDLSEYKDSQSVPLFMQWDQRWGYLNYGGKVAGLSACGPVCLSMVTFYLSGDDAYTPEKIIRFAADNGYHVKGSGSSWKLISEGGEKLGFQVTELPLVKGKIVNSLNAGNPVICAMGPGDFTTTGHFIVLTGVEDGKFRVNDPNSVKNSQRLWSYEEIEGQIRNLWSVANG